MFKNSSIRLTLFILAFNVSFVWAEPLKVAVSIPPLHSLVAQIGAGVFEPSLVYALDQSPHASALKPSQLKQVVEADLLVWVDETLEQSLGRLLTQRPVKGVTLQLYAENGAESYESALQLLENRPSLFPQSIGLHAGHDETSEAGSHDHDHAHDHGQLDPHFWLSINNAVAFSQAVTEQLVAIDPEHQAVYTANFKKLSVELNLLNQKIMSQMAGVRTVPFIVFHDGFQYFEKAYQLRGIGAVVLIPDQPPGPKTVNNLIIAAQKNSVVCLFSEPQYDQRYLQIIKGKLPAANIAVIDPLGSQLQQGASLYANLLMQLSTSMVECLE